MGVTAGATSHFGIKRVVGTGFRKPFCQPRVRLSKTKYFLQIIYVGSGYLILSQLVNDKTGCGTRFGWGCVETGLWKFLRQKVKSNMNGPECAFWPPALPHERGKIGRPAFICNLKLPLKWVGHPSVITYNVHVLGCFPLSRQGYLIRPGKMVHHESQASTGECLN